MEYTVIFDVSQNGYGNWWFPASGLLFIVAGSFFFFLRHKLGHSTPPPIPQIFLGFAILWTIFAFATTLGGYSSLAAALREGRCEVVEGEVTQFHPMPASGHDTERFVVGDHAFSYSDYILSPGFRNTR